LSPIGKSTDCLPHRFQVMTVLALFLLWQVIAVPPLDGGQVRDLTEPVSPRGKKQEGIRKRRHAQGTA
jgi:hypothetical protein